MNIKSLFNLRSVAFELHDKVLSSENRQIDHLVQQLISDPYQLSNEYYLVRSIFPSMSLEDFNNFFLLLKIIQEEKVKKESIEIVATIPEKYELNIRETLPAIRQLLQEAKSNIHITGFAISAYFEDIFDLLVQKNSEGVIIDFYIDNNKQTIETVSNLCKYINSNTFNVYKYIGNDSGSQLHSKTMIVDKNQGLISSANLSYNGFVNNIEIGVLISGDLVATVIQVFNELRKNGHFEKVSQVFFRRGLDDSY